MSDALTEDPGASAVIVVVAAPLKNLTDELYGPVTHASGETTHIWDGPPRPVSDDF